MDSISAVLVRIVFVAVSIIASSEALQCLSCDHVVETRDCSHVVTCGPHEECYTEHLTAPNLSQYYRMGCRPTSTCASFSLIGKKRQQSTSLNQRRGGDQILCSQCCNNTNFCNMNICGSVPTNKLRCMSCTDVLNAKDCGEITECSKDELCYVTTGHLTLTYKFRTSMGCMGSLQCEALKRAYSQRCVACCDNDDFCNYNACDNFTNPAHTTPTATSTKAYPLTTTSTLNGKPTVSVSLSQITANFALQCYATGNPTPIVTWTFVSDLSQSTTLPPGIQHSDLNNTHILFVANYIPSIHNGNYVCIASNPDGIATGQIHVP